MAEFTLFVKEIIFDTKCTIKHTAHGVGALEWLVHDFYKYLIKKMEAYFNR